MGTVDDFFYDVSQSARTSLVGSMDDDPEEAARAITIGKTTGMSPESIVGNLDEVERQNKAALGSAIVNDNHYIADYLASNPMAPKVSHDDLGQMDEASLRISNMLPDGAVKRWLKSDTIQKSFMEGFGEAPIGSSIFKNDKDYQLAKDYPLFAATAAAVATPIEALGRTFGGLIHMTRDAMAVPFGDKFANETAAMLEYMMMRGDIGVKSAGGGATGPLGIIEQNTKLFKDMSGAVRAADPYLKTDTNPPPGVHPVIDDIKKQESREDIKNLDQALSESVKSATRERAPDLYAQFVKGHVGDREIGIDSAAIRQLYGDKVPQIDDNILGWAPDIANRLAAAELTGGDVQIPLSEWLAKVDPDVAKQLHDHIRVRDGGVTLDETKTVETIQTSAIEVGGERFTGQIHGDAIDAFFTKYPDVNTRELTGRGYKEGFITSTGRFVDRTEAAEIAKKAEQLKPIEKISAGESQIKTLDDIKSLVAEDLLPSKLHPRLMGPKEAVPDPHTLVRGSAGLEPLFSVGDRKVTLERKGATEGSQFGPQQGFHDFDLIDETGQTIGTINLSKQGEQLYIEMIQAGPKEKKFYDPNFLGPSLIRDLLRQLKAEFPDAKSITGHRAGGARWKGKEDTATDIANAMPVVKFDVLDNIQPFRDLLTAHWDRVHPDVEVLRKDESLWTQHEKDLREAIHDEAMKITGIKPEVVSAIYYPKEGKGAGGTYTRGGLRDGFQPNIFISLEGAGGDKVGVYRHEAIHLFRDMGLITEKEWSTLTRAARDEGWVQRYNIEKRYPNLPMEGKLEEAIAEGYKYWKSGDLILKDPTIYQKLKDFFEALHRRFKEILGRDFTWEELFKEIDAGAMKEAEPNSRRSMGEPKTSIEEFRRAANDNLKVKVEEVEREPPPVSAKTIYTDNYNNWRGELDRRSKEMGELLLKPDFSEFDGKRYDKLYQQYNQIHDAGYENYTKPPKASFGEEGDEGPGLYDRGKALGVTQSHMNRMLDLIRKRNEEDLAKHEARAIEDQRRKTTKEWKARRTELRDEVREQLEARPDLATDELFAKGQIKLHPDFLTDEQKAMLPKDYLQKKNGVNPDELAPYFGYTSGSALVDRLGLLTEDRRASGMSQRDYFNRLVDVETDRRLNSEFGDINKRVMEEAKDQALSETQLNLVHEETLAYAQAAGIEPKFTKEEVSAMVKQVFEQVPIGQISSDRLLQNAGKIGKKIEEAEAKGKWDEAYRLSQQRQHAVVAAKFARDYEKARRSFDRTAKMFRKREVPSVGQEWTNWVHDLMVRVGLPVNRSVQDLAENIGRQGETNLRDFIEAKETEWMGLREVPVADYLLDENFRKSLKELSHFDFMGLKESIDTLYKAGRDEKKIYREGEAADRDAVLKEMRDKLATFPLKEFPATKGAIRKALELPKVFMAGMTNIETLMNRFDRADPRGVFNQYISYPLAKASNQKNVLEREYARALENLGKVKDRDKLVDAPFADPLSRTDANPDGTRWTGFTRNNVLAMLQNAGNKSNWNVLARGFGMNPESLMQWLHKNTTKEDWDRAQKMGDAIFKSLVARADKVYEQITGATIEKIPLEPIDTPYGTYPGWYHPLIADPLRKEVWAQDDAGQWQRKPVGKKGSVYDDGDFFHASTANGYTKRRTGAIYPLDLNFDVVPARIKQMTHDIAFRQVILETEKIFNNRSFNAEVTKHYGEHYSDLLMPYLKNMAGAESIASRAQSKAAQVSEFLRQNVISTYIGFNPYTALKHGPTAWVMSMREVGPKDFLQAATSLYGKSPEIGLSNSEFAMKWSEELQRRERHWQDTIAGEHASLEGSKNIRQNIIEKGSWLVAQSDMLSAKPTWVAAYNKYLADGLSHGESIDLADRAVRRAHGSTSQTNQPALVRGGGPLHGWLTSVYGFFGTAMQRRIEIAHELNDAYGLGREGEIKAAAAKVPSIAADIFTYVIWPTIIEEWVTGLTTDDRRGWGTHLAAGAFMGLSSSVLYLRDLAHAAVTGHDPGVGLLSSGLHDANQLLRDFKKGKEAMNRQNAGKTVGDTITVFGELTGMAPKTVANATRFGIDLVNKQTNPKGPSEIARGITRGTTKLRVEK